MIALLAAVGAWLLTRLAFWGVAAAGTFAAAGLTRLSARLLHAMFAIRTTALVRRPPPPDWPTIIARNVPLADRLSGEERARHLDLIRVFLEDVRFEGCNGLLVTEEMRVTIAAQACLLLVNLRFPAYPRLRRILLYPETFVPKRMPGSMTEGDAGARLGEAWTDGTVVLSWRSVRHGINQPFDGTNLVLHEFAHVLDGADGVMDGMPPVRDLALGQWAGVLKQNYRYLVRLARRGSRSVLDHYGATNEAEFFAVATETFFEQPDALRRKMPELYDALRELYRQDPAERRVSRYGEAPALPGRPT